MTVNGLTVPTVSEPQAKSIKEKESDMTKSIQEWYAGKSILITGGTGFMGKVLIEKLLRVFPDIKNVYLLTRAKRELTMYARIEGMAKLPLFQPLIAANKDALKKLVPINCDMSLEGLGISDDDRKILAENVSVVFHMAATLRLEAPVKDAVIQNTLGTMRLLELCREFKKLESFVHLSTAFCHCDVEVLEEKVYPPTKDPYEVMKLVQSKTTQEIEAMEKTLLEPHPNSYIFSKRLAEVVANDMGKVLPVSIARPSIVLPTLRDPIPGWVDSLNGPIGVLVAGGKGVLRTMMCDINAHVQIAPVDTCINALSTIAWKRATETFRETPVYNITGDVKYTWGQILDKGKKAIHKNPFEWTLWYPGGGPTTNRFLHNLIIIFCHYLPAYFIDFLLLIFGQKRFLVRVQNRISLGLDLLEYFTIREWHFEVKNLISLDRNFSEEDLENFAVLKSKYDADEYIEDCILGARLYCIKENPKTLPACRAYLKFLYCLDRFTKVLICYFIATWVLSCLGLPNVLSFNFWMNGTISGFIK